VIDEQTGIAIVEPFKRALLQGTDDGWRDYIAMTTAHRHTLRPGTRHTIIRDKIVAQFKASLDRPPNTYYARQGLLELLVFPDLATLIVKKLGDGFQPSYYPTEQARLFYENTDAANGQLDLPGVPWELPRLVWGYKPNKLGDWYQGIWLAYTYKGRVAWTARMDSVQTPVITILPKVAAAAGTPAKKQRIRKKGASNGSRKAKGGDDA